MKRHPTFVRVPPFPTMVETWSDRCFHIYHRTRASRAKACAKSYDKWKRLTIPSEVLIVPKPKEKKKKSAKVSPGTPARTKLSPLKSPPMTDTIIPLSSALKREMNRQIQYQREHSGAFVTLMLLHSSWIRQVIFIALGIGAKTYSRSVVEVVVKHHTPCFECTTSSSIAGRLTRLPSSKKSTCPRCITLISTISTS